MSNLAIGNIIKDLRKSKRLTGSELGKKVGLSQAKISKIESGTNRLDQAELERVLMILEAPQSLRQKVLSLLAEAQPSVLSSIPYKPYWTHARALEYDSKATEIRIYLWCLVPALLQTTEYRRALMKGYDISEEAILNHLKVSLARQELLWDKNKRFHFILHESVLYGKPSTRNVQTVQLNRLERYIGQPNIKLGIVAFKSSLPIVDGSSFALFDDRFIVTSAVGTDIVSKDSELIRNHVKAFNAYDDVACYGDEARALLYQAIDYFS